VVAEDLALEALKEGWQLSGEAIGSISVENAFTLELAGRKAVDGVPRFLGALDEIEGFAELLDLEGAGFGVGVVDQEISPALVGD
jgi:hypothetical protein